MIHVMPWVSPNFCVKNIRYTPNQKYGLISLLYDVLYYDQLVLSMSTGTLRPPNKFKHGYAEVERTQERFGSLRTGEEFLNHPSGVFDRH